MKLGEIAARLEFEDLTPGREEPKSHEPSSGYCSDLLSDVLAHAPGGGILVTVQCHMNVVAVASHASLLAVVFAGGRRPERTVVHKAEEEGLQLYGSESSAFDLAGKLYELGLRGPRR